MEHLVEAHKAVLLVAQLAEVVEAVEAVAQLEEVAVAQLVEPV